MFCYEKYKSSFLHATLKRTFLYYYCFRTKYFHSIDDNDDENNKKSSDKRFLCSVSMPKQNWNSPFIAQARKDRFLWERCDEVINETRGGRRRRRKARTFWATRERHSNAYRLMASTSQGCRCRAITMCRPVISYPLSCIYLWSWVWLRLEDLFLS